MEKNNKNRSIYYPDVSIFLVAIPIISAINYYLTYANVKFNGFLLLTFTIDTVTGYIAWYFVRKLILFLDLKLPYDKGILKRLGVQIPATTFLGLAIISFLTELTSFIAKGESAPLDFYTIDLIIIGIWFFFINALYLGLYYYNQWKKTEQKIAKEEKLRADGFVVKVGKKDLKLDFERLAGFFVDADYTIAQDLSGKKFYLDDSLERIENRVPAHTFFRLNRKYILHRKMISGFQRVENGKLLVLLHETDFFPSNIPVSRTKAPSFKRWFRPT
ncbi:LytTR family DNA-binding domain-containing protein [Flagellimonas flava]|uniref:DNA-binding response regulator, LytR/AlgR family n=1 Tax=Flagellimonas flava TaxID=570519 RepID=A0A1M5ICM8_9FLAO|nr:LytTR family DNA-binding domain-containing protein [Allomuricauda flava]SHG25995.1 DNA-binding response regulator, LytR/AlgR family [Allomuricauda flava]